jgi:hypothetical protein
MNRGKDGRLNQTTKFFLLLGILTGILATGSFLFGDSRSLVDWRSLRAVVIESDDWGLAGFVPDGEAWSGLDRQALETGSFPPVYWLSTLEDSLMVSALNTVLARHEGRDGRPAVFQPNYVMSSLAYVQDTWTRFDLPNFPPSYQRPGLWEAVHRGIADGTWYPEFHATWHYDPDVRKQEALGNDFARQVTSRGIMLFPGSEGARELGAWRSRQELEGDLDHSLAVFLNLFGRKVNAVMAPDYHWDGRIESMWENRNLRVIQGKREQINPAWGSGSAARVRKYLDRQWSRWRHSGRIYLERNCRLEPVQAPDPAAVVKACVADTRKAWAAGQPAIVESHRINFVHTDSALVAAGLAALDRYLGEISNDPAGAPVYLTDHELAQLLVKGTSWRVQGGGVVVRNATRGKKVVAIPAAALARAAGPIGGSGIRQTKLVAVPAGSTFNYIP